MGHIVRVRGKIYQCPSLALLYGTKLVPWLGCKRNYEEKSESNLSCGDQEYDAVSVEVAALSGQTVCEIPAIVNHSKHLSSTKTCMKM